MLDVMSIAAAVAAAWEPALPVAGGQRAAQCRREGARAAPDVQDLAARPMAHRDGGRVARYPPGRIRGDVDPTRLVEHGLAAGGRCAGRWGRVGAR